MNPRRIKGPWKDGYTLDEHTISSVPIGYDEFGHTLFDTKRSDVGERLYQLKYRGDRSQIAPLAKAAQGFVKNWGVMAQLVVPVPPTRVRSFQPVVAVAEQLADLLGVPLDSATIRRTTRARELKGVTDPAQRAELLSNAFRAEGTALRGKHVLLFDDLYRSGATMKAVSQLLANEAGASAVFALALTRTRSIR